MFSADVCLEPKKVGPCEALIKRFYFDQEKGRCKRFDYGGCEGNGNNFETKRKCMTTCPGIQGTVCTSLFSGMVTTCLA